MAVGTCPTFGPQGVVIQMSYWVNFGTFVIHTSSPAAVYARLRYGQEYSGDWIVSSPRRAELLHCNRFSRWPGVKGAILNGSNMAHGGTFVCIHSLLSAVWIWHRYGCGDQHGCGYDMVRSCFLHKRWARVASDTVWTALRREFFCRNLPHVQYELYDACLARDPVTAMNKMGAPLSQKPTGWRLQGFWERCVTPSAKKHQQAALLGFAKPAMLPGTR